ncbi:MAG: hypothetical protein ABI813_07870 [Bacteroidota bacterium]
MTENLYITASCRIADNVVDKDEKRLFENKGITLQPFLVSVYQYFAINYPRFYKMDNLAKLGWLATELLLENSFEKFLYKPEDIGLVLSNKNSSLDTDIKYYQTVKTIASPALFVYTLPNIVLGEICIRHNIKGENDFFIFEDFNAAFIQQYVAHLFTTGAMEACICGWVEVVKDEYLACLYLVEKTAKPTAKNFTIENIHHIYQKNHG